MFRAFKIAIILLIFLEYVEVGLLAEAGRGSKLFYMDVVMEASIFHAVLVAATTHISSTVTQGCHKGALLIFCPCSQV